MDISYLHWVLTVEGQLHITRNTYIYEKIIKSKKLKTLNLCRSSKTWNRNSSLSKSLRIRYAVINGIRLYKVYSGLTKRRKSRNKLPVRLTITFWIIKSAERFEYFDFSFGFVHFGCGHCQELTIFNCSVFYYLTEKSRF